MRPVSRSVIPKANMKKFTLLITLVLLASVAFGSQTDEWISGLEHPRWPSEELKPENKISHYLSYDFTDLFMPRSHFLGYIGLNYKRIRIKFTAISKKAPDTYSFRGISLRGGIQFGFEGEVKITQIREYKEMHFGVDDELKDAGFKSQGILLGNYKFNENQNKPQSGVFEGVMTLYWFINRNNNIQYDDVELLFSDNYRNNQYIGTWKQYGSNKPITCNWGEYRIPFSGDLDIGAGEFGVNPKYYNQGWEDFKYQ